MSRPVVIKLGGAALPHKEAALADLRALREAGLQPVLVHGGGPVISEWLARIGKEAVFVDGLRQTDAETLTVAIMTLAGKVNKELVADLQQGGTPAIGVCGVDGGSIRAHRQTEPDIGFVGVVDEVDPAPLRALTSAGYTPVIAPIALGPEGPLNINADTVAGDIARALDAEALIFLTDVPGVKDRAGAVLPALDRAQAEALRREGVISGGMIPKVEACLRCLDRVPRASIVDGAAPHALVEHLLNGQSLGTVFTA
jgi:acetylglutamate kinase